MTKTAKPTDSSEARWIVGTIATAAAFHRVSPRMLAELLADGCPGERGNYNVADQAEWRRLNRAVSHSDAKRARQAKAVQQSAGADDESESLEQLEKRKLKTQCEFADLKLARALGLVVDRKAVCSEVETMIVAAKERLLSIPEEMGSSIPPNLRPDVVADWTRGINGILRELAGFELQEGKPMAKSSASKAASGRRRKKKPDQAK